MALTLAEIRAKLQSQESEQTKYTSDGASYRFWDTPAGKTSVLRFLPDADADNDFFWQRKFVYRFPFNGIKGGQGDLATRKVQVQVPCMRTWGDTEADLVLQEMSDWWNDPELKDLARQYYFKRSYIYQGFVVESGFNEETPPENLIRRFNINRSIHDIIKASLMDPEFESLPVDYVSGTDFRLTCTKSGEYNNYDTSSWSRKERGLNEMEALAIEENGLFNLSDYIPQKPDQAAQQLILEMFQASIDGEPYDPERFASHYKPFGVDLPGFNNKSKSEVKTAVEATPVVAATTTPAPVVETVAETPVAAVTPTSGIKASPMDILNKLKNAKRNNEA